MIAKLFDVQNGRVVPTEHCYTIKWLKDIMDEYQEDDEYLKVYCYIFYMTFPNPDENPYFNMPELSKEESIIEDLDAAFSTEDPKIQYAISKCKEMFSTPISRAYDGIAGMLDKLATYMRVTQVSDGRDGNISQIRAVAKDFESIRQSFKGAYKDMKEEHSSRVRGGKGLGYDQI